MCLFDVATWAAVSMRNKWFFLLQRESRLPRFTSRGNSTRRGGKGRRCGARDVLTRVGVNHCRDVTSPGRASFTPGIRNGSSFDRLLTFPYEALALVRDRSVKTTAYTAIARVLISRISREGSESKKKKILNLFTSF